MLTAAEFKSLAQVLGEPVTFRQAKAPNATYSVRAIVQDMSRAPEPVVNALGLSGRMVQFSCDGFLVKPEKFDQVTRASGERITIDLVNMEAERGTGAIHYVVAFGKAAG